MDKAALLADQVSISTGEVDLGRGTVTVRGLSRYEMVLASKVADGDDLRQERMILSMAMVEPKLTEDEVETWQKMSVPGEINLVATKINELSGIGKDAGKSDVPAV